MLSAGCTPHILVLAPGWSSGSYALQILHGSPGFVFGIKNSCAVITDLNRMRLRGPGYVAGGLFMRGKKRNPALFFPNVGPGHRRALREEVRLLQELHLPPHLPRRLHPPCILL